MRFVKMAAPGPLLYEDSILFDSESPHWRPDADYNRLYLTAVINHMRQIKLARGHLFLNEFHDEIGMPRTFAGQTSGWWETDVSITLHPSTDDLRPWLLIWVERDIHAHLT